MVRSYIEDGYALILLDSSIFPVAPYITYGWFPVGSRPVIKYEHKRREKHCVLGALTQEQFLYLFSDSIHSAVFECFVRMLIERFGKVVIVMDRAPCHKSWSMMGFYLINDERLKVIFLPSYSPELNPVEPVWKGTKKWLGIRCWSTKAGLRRELESAFREDFVLVNFYDYLLP